MVEFSKILLVLSIFIASNGLLHAFQSVTLSPSRKFCLNYGQTENEETERLQPNAHLAGQDSSDRATIIWKSIVRSLSAAALGITITALSGSIPIVQPLSVFAADNIATTTTIKQGQAIINKEYAKYAPKKSVRPYAYSVEMARPPFLLPRSHPNGEKSLIQRLAKADTLLFGEHNLKNSKPESLAVDRKLEVDLIARLRRATSRPFVIYLQSIPRTPSSIKALTNFMENTNPVVTEDTYNELSQALGITRDEMSSFQFLLQYLHDLVHNPSAAAATAASVTSSTSSSKSSSSPLDFFSSLDNLNPFQGGGLGGGGAARIILRPLGLPPTILQRVMQGGLDNLLDEEKQALVNQPAVFLQIAQARGFPRYIDQVINQAQFLSSLNTDDNSAEVIKKPEEVQKRQRRFVSAKMLSQEHMAEVLSLEYQTAASAADQEPDTAAAINGEDVLRIALLDKDDVIFGFGVEERVKRILNPLEYLNNDEESKPAEAAGGEDEAAAKKKKAAVREETLFTSSRTKEEVKEESLHPVYSILLNPTAKDSLSYSAQLRYTLAYGDDIPYQRPLADFLWFSEYPPVKILARMKNEISREGDKPPGESSVIGVFQ